MARDEGLYGPGGYIRNSFSYIWSLQDLTISGNAESDIAGDRRVGSVASAIRYRFLPSQVARRSAWCPSHNLIFSRIRSERILSTIEEYLPSYPMLYDNYAHEPFPHCCYRLAQYPIVFSFLFFFFFFLPEYGLAHFLYIHQQQVAVWCWPLNYDYFQKAVTLL